ncbi:HNH endonuclease [Escherichia phage vB_EcoS_AHP42]|uniref:HNH endonuclease n=1 Tax=Escherichia phage vB_EcoS_AHP42 TaxID=1416028 RepID=A0A067YXJ0_9CAUD|nr:HNH endonuclease [Escherichia phage vB_EcoS_AHP42]AHI60568.1 HNH endonuclease [Escherichia phage vB_EcoS_AHP42]
MNWNEIFEYRDGKLYWKVKLSRKVKVGSEAGCSSYANKGYCIIKVQGKVKLRHRIIWEMHNGPIPEKMEIDHIKGVDFGDFIENLRCVTKIDNQRNTKRPRTNNSGVIGVCFCSSSCKWKASIGDGSGKSGKVVYFGDSFDEAVRARRIAEIEFGYHKNHGR